MCSRGLFVNLKEILYEHTTVKPGMTGVRPLFANGAHSVRPLRGSWRFWLYPNMKEVWYERTRFCHTTQ